MPSVSTASLMRSTPAMLMALNIQPASTWREGMARL